MDRLEHALKHCKKVANNRPDRASFIYIIECHEYVKVGIANDPTFRLVELQVGCPYELRLLASFHVPRAAQSERRLHSLWKQYELRGEWFKVPPGELAYVLSSVHFEDIFKCNVSL